ncbi:MAG: 5'-methylthioadenosine/S-adenosylhomocysteine nucleosidase [Dehalococcoidia bacterium]
MSGAPIAVVVPVDGEFEPYRAILPSLQRRDDSGPWEVYEGRSADRRMLLVISGAGPVNAAAATERLIARYEPAAVLHGGSAGAHNPDLLPGDVVIGSRYVIHTSRSVRAARVARGLNPSLIRYRQDGSYLSYPHIDADPRLLALAERVARAELERIGNWQAPGWPPAVPRRPGLVVSGVVASADAWTIDEAELRALHEDFGAECEDMESAYVAQVCALHRLPFVAVRVMSDNEAAQQLTAEDVPPAIAAAGERAATIIVALAGAI